MTTLFDPDWFRDEFVIFVPDNWTAEQALAIHELLERLTTAIWKHYEGEMIPLIVSDPDERQIEMFPEDNDSDPSDDEIPF